jgi:ATP-dependent RNA helicase HelY
VMDRRNRPPRHPTRRRPFRYAEKKVQESRSPFRAHASPQLVPLLDQIGVPEAAPFVPDPFQQEALAALESGDVLVTAPTGAGKTWIALKAMEQRLTAGQRSWYASPLKALSNAKYVEFSREFGEENVGILTGDRKEKPHAPIVVGTTEILRNQLYDSMHRGEDLTVHLVVLDEAHYLGDEDRGVVWEEVMIYLPPRVRLLLLSATVSNADQIAGWMAWLRQVSCSVVFAKERPVPLHPLFMFPSGEVTPFLRRGAMAGKVRHFVERSPGSGITPRQGVANFSQIIGALRELDLLPAIFFLKSRADCNLAIQAALPRRVNVETDEERQRFHRRLQDLLQAQPYLKRHRDLAALRQGRVAAHHGGQLPAWKVLIEAAMNEGYLDAIFSTSTVAAGVNFPARTVVLSQSDRFNGREFVPLSATDLLQMTGRAGRRGMDNVGFVVLLPGPYQDAHLISNLLHAVPEPVNSQIHITFSMVLNLLLSHPPEEVRVLLARSFATYQDLDENREILRQVKEAEQELAEDLRATPCGELDAVLTTLSKKRELERALEEARQERRRGRQRLLRQAYVNSGRVFVSKSGETFVVLRQESRNQVDGVLAIRVTPKPRLRRGRFRTRWLRLGKVQSLLDCHLDLPDSARPELWLEYLEAHPVEECQPLDLRSPLPSPWQEAWAHLGARVAALEAAVAAHRCVGCPQGNSCDPRKRNRFRDKIDGALALRERLDAVTNRFWREFNRYCEFLQQEGYVDPAGRLTPDGMWASQLRLDQPLMIAEGIRQGVFPDTDPALLAGLIAPFVSDRDQQDKPPARHIWPHTPIGQVLARMASALRPLQLRLRHSNFPVNPISFWPAAALHAWASGAAWDEILELSGLDEGDLATLIYRTADNLRQIEGLRQSHPSLATSATGAIARLLREPVPVPK